MKRGLSLMNRRRVLSELGRDSKGRRKTVVTLNTERRLRKKLDAAKREIASLKLASSYERAEVARLRGRLQQKESLELPESYLTKIMDTFITNVADKFARDAMANGARADYRSLQYAAELLTRGAMPRHTLFTLDQAPLFLVEEMIESGDLRFTFTTEGPVAMHWMASKGDQKDLGYARHIARDPYERFYRLDALPRFIGDYIDDNKVGPKPKMIFFPH